MNTISFPKMFNINSSRTSTNLSYNYKSIHESLTSLIMTNPGELLGDPNYGCALRTKLFDVKSGYNMTELRNIIIAVIDKYMPYITVRHDDIKIYSNSNDNKYKITIYYTANNDEKSNLFELII